MNEREMFARLMTLRDSAGELHYERISLAAKLLANKGWVEDPTGGGGDESKSLDRLESECFGDICGLVSLNSLLDLYANVSDKKVWRKANWNLSKIWSDYKASQKPEKANGKKLPTSRAAREYTNPNSFRDLTPSRQVQEYTRVLSRVETDSEKIERLEAELIEKDETIRKLKEEIKRYKQGAKNLFQIA